MAVAAAERAEAEMMVALAAALRADAAGRSDELCSNPSPNPGPSPNPNPNPKPKP